MELIFSALLATRLMTLITPDSVIEERREHPEGALFDCREVKVGRGGHLQEVLGRVKTGLDGGHHHGPDEGREVKQAVVMESHVPKTDL